MRDSKTVLVTGGAGYVGGVLVPKLLGAGYEVRVLDLYIYGREVFDEVRPNSRLMEIQGDIRDTEIFRRAVADCDAVIHLACISNDPSADLDPDLTKSINYDCFPAIVAACKEANVRRFIFASSSSVYGISEALRVTEDHERLPITAYNRYKALCEDILLEAQSETFAVTIIRPATVCGYSPRLRLDLTVNILTSHAVNKGLVTVFGGDQYRPNLHIQDMTDLYMQLLEEPIGRISGKVYNAGYQNQRVADIAAIVKNVVEQRPGHQAVAIKKTPSDDVRSYRITCDKLENELGYRPQRSIEDAVEELCRAFENDKVPDALTSSRYVNIKRMKEIGLS